MGRSEKDHGRTGTGARGEPASAEKPRRLTGLRSAPAAASSAGGGGSSARRNLSTHSRIWEHCFKRFKATKTEWELVWNEKPFAKQRFENLSKQVVKDRFDSSFAQEKRMLGDEDEARRDCETLRRVKSDIKNSYTNLTETLIPKVRQRLDEIGSTLDRTFCDAYLRKAELRCLRVLITHTKREDRRFASLLRRIDEELAELTGGGRFSERLVTVQGTSLSAILQVVGEHEDLLDGLRSLLSQTD